jgi:hypothetical protein
MTLCGDAGVIWVFGKYAVGDRLCAGHRDNG